MMNRETYTVANNGTYNQKSNREGTFTHALCSTYEPYHYKSGTIVSEPKKLQNLLDIKHRLYNEETLNAIITEDREALNEKSYQTIKSMLSSNDGDNVSLGMELLSNCNFKESLSYIFLLLSSNYSKIAQRKEYNHSSFKAIKTLIGVDIVYFGLDQCIEILEKYNKVTPNNLNILMDYYLSDEGAKRMHEINVSQYFKCGSIALTDNLVSLLPKEKEEVNGSEFITL